MNKSKINQRLIFFLKIVVLIAVFYYLATQIQKQLELKEIKILIFNSLSLFYFILILLLFIVNWSIEAKKWQILTSNFEKQSYIDSIKTIFSAISIGMLTPARIGEIPARSFFFRSNNKLAAAISASISSLTQMGATLILGVLSFPFWFTKFQNQQNNILLFIFSIFLLVLFLLLFFNLNQISHLKFIPENTKKKIQITLNTPRQTLFKLFLLSTLRYAVFLIQFFLWIKIYHINLSFFETSLGLSLSFLASSFIPFFSLAEFGLRSGTAVFFFSTISHQLTEIALATSSLWLINVAFPAFLGIFILFLNKHK